MISGVHDSSNRHRYRKGRLLAAAVLAGLLAVPATAAASQASATQAAASTSCPWVTSRAPIAQRVAQLMSQMSLADKITMVEGHGTTNPYVFYTPAIPSLCIPAVGLEDGPAGVADGLTGVTQLPAGVSLAATWDPSLAEQYGQVIGAEEYGKGASANLGPTVNIDRDPRWGRSFEALSEDPALNAALDVPEIAGVQSQDVESQVKHLAVYNQETYRNTPADNVIIDPRTENEIYLPSFYAAVKSGVASVMCSYAVINGNFACNNSDLETTILRDEWGFPGFVMSDYGALHSTQGAVQGTDQEQPFNTYYGTALQTAIQNGTIPISALNTMVQRVFTEMFRFNLFSQPRTGSPTDTVTTPAHVALTTPGRRGRDHAAEERRLRAAAVFIGRRHHRRRRPGRGRLADLRGRRQRLRDPLGHGEPAGRHQGRRRERDERRLLPGPAGRHVAALDPLVRPVAGLRAHPVRRQLHGYAHRAGDRHLRAGRHQPVRLLHLDVPVAERHAPHRRPGHAAGVNLLGRGQPDRGQDVHAVDQRRLLPAAVGDAVGAGARHRRRGQPPPSRHRSPWWWCPTTPSPRRRTGRR